MTAIPPINGRTGEVLADRVRWTIPRDQAAGDYTLTAGLPIRRSVSLGTITVAGVPRLFDPPAVDHVDQRQFRRSDLLLYGYILQPRRR